MGIASYSMGEDYWDNFKLQEEDIEFLYNYLLETETPMTSMELIEALVGERIQQQRAELEKQRMSGGDLYQPKLDFRVKQKLVFPALNWQHGQVLEIRQGLNPEIGDFQVIQVALDDGTRREFAAQLPIHKLNDPPKIVEEFNHLDTATVLRIYQKDLLRLLEDELTTNPGFVSITGRWFPRALLIDINLGHLNLAEAVLDMAGGGPMPTSALLDQIEIKTDVNPKLLEFSMALALQEDARFDEVGPAGDVLWYLKRLEPQSVLQTPVFLRYNPVDYDTNLLTAEMLALEQSLDDELSPVPERNQQLDEVEVRLIFPHWRSGTLPLSVKTRYLFPTAYEAPRVRFMLVDGESQEKFPGWVVREKSYVYGLEEWYDSRGVIPGSIIHVRRGSSPGEVIVHTGNHRPSREWIRTLLVGSDGGIVFAMLKQTVATPVDDRMAIAIPEKTALDQNWLSPLKDQPPFEKLVVNTVRDLARLNPQSHVHFTELYSAINVIRRCPPGPIMALLNSRPWFIHVGDLHYRLSDTEYD
ncbi:MAG: hypothetical protein B6D39_05965 [Anaerolineae bacterium UTCFX2]|nr:hypothetical protein [Anaerolineales bacterium]OQY91785.1 MAG: hypothetical protein B6D39_05965 [Anaerolineae bacterium UTCFX2]